MSATSGERATAQEVPLISVNALRLVAESDIRTNAENDINT